MHGREMLGGEMLAGRLLPPGIHPEATGTVTGLGRAGCKLRLRSSPGHTAHAMGRRQHSPPKQIQAWVSSGPSSHSRNTQPIR